MRYFAVAFLAFAAFAAFAQEANQGTITGYIYDQSQSVVPNADVTVTSRATGLARGTQANAEGLYTVLALQPGVYDVKASSTGFKTVEQRGIVLNVGASIRINFNMEVGAVAETITVEDAAPVLKTESGEVSNLVTGIQISDIPVNGRNFTQFLSLGTGVVSQQSGRQMGLGQEGNPLMAVHGSRISMNKYTYDGTLAMDTGGNRGLDLFPPMEAVGEVKVQKSNYGADAGGFGYGIVNVVTKSGTQEFHGDVYEYFRNDKLDARNFFANQRQSIRLNNFGATIGGPFYIPGKYNTDKTKDFFFYSQSFARRIGPQITSFTTPPLGVFTGLVPTQPERNGTFASTIRDPDNANAPFPGNTIPANRIDRNATILINAFFPLPNRAGTQNFVHNTRSFTRYREELMRWDHNFNSNWILTSRYAQDTWYQDQDIKKPGPSVLPTFPNLIGKPGSNWTTKLTTIASPTKVNLFTFGYSFNKITNEPLGGFKPQGLSIPEAFPANEFNRAPTITFAGGYAGLGAGDALNNSNPIYTFKDDFSWTRGRHTWKFGAEIVHHRKTEISYANEQGDFNFNAGVTGNAFADFLLGRAFTYTENERDPDITVHAWDNEFYFQDDFKATSKLTLNYGLRYYMIRGSNGGAAVDNNFSVFVPGLYDPARAPRFLADGQIVPGSGDPLNGLITPDDRKGLDLNNALEQPDNKAFGPRFGLAYSLSPKTVIRGGYGINYFWGTANNVPRKLNPPFSNSVNIQNASLANPTGGPNRLFPANLNTKEIRRRQPQVQSWSFNVQRQLTGNTSFEVGYAGTRGNFLPRGVQLNQADPNRTGNANLRRPYLGYGTISMNENSAVSKYHGLEASFVRRFAGGLMFETSYTWSKAIGHVEGNTMDARNKNLDFGLQDLDRTHMFTFNYVWEIPFLKGRGGAAGAILGGWQLSGITSFMSGLPINVNQAGDVANFGGGTAAQRPNLIGNQNQGRGASLFRYFNTDAYERVTATGIVGNAPPNSVRGPGINNFDMALLKSFKVRESMRFQFGVETFNTFNHAQFEAVGAQIGAVTFGQVTDARDPRVIQLRAKFTY